MSHIGGFGGAGGEGAGGGPSLPSDTIEAGNTGYPGILNAFPRFLMSTKFNSNTALTVCISATGGVGDGVSTAGGGAGAGGGVVCIMAKECDGALLITSTGGLGADGPASDCGGGGGGGGGVIVFCTTTPQKLSNYTFNVDHGKGGTSGGGAGTDGNPGLDGEIYLIEN